MDKCIWNCEFYRRPHNIHLSNSQWCSNRSGDVITTNNDNGPNGRYYQIANVNENIKAIVEIHGSANINMCF